MKNSNNLSQKLTKGELKNIFGGGPILTQPMCTPRQCEIHDTRCDYRHSCPPLYPQPD
ncbi:hypothetical protein [Chryseobacterium sp.]|uniref:hypothetical protein n=1 Tax=Chryseobacterium sp. TaxID=1871047 RepID=UPI002605BFDC|nr:hypothetical protein [Chryseobacterium sp.]